VIEHELRIDRIVAAVVALEAALDPTAVRTVITEFATTPRTSNILATYLEQRPDGLTSGASEGPLILQRIVPALRAIGARRVAGPRCLTCSREQRLPHRRGAGRICVTCYSHTMVRQCGRCGEARRLALSRDGDVCERCYRADPARFEKCARCGTNASVERRLEEGPICGRCYVAIPNGVCGKCGEPCHVKARDGSSVPALLHATGATVWEVWATRHDPEPGRSHQGNA
jgi:hypothetical protein